MGFLKSFYDKIGASIGILISFSAFMMLAEIFYRSILGKTFFVVAEYAGYIMAAVSFLGLSYGEMYNAHIRLNFVDKLKNNKLRKFLTKTRYLVGLVFSVYLTYVLFLIFYESFIYKSVSLQVSETPLAFPQFFLFLGGFLLVIVYAFKLVKEA